MPVHLRLRPHALVFGTFPQTSADSGAVAGTLHTMAIKLSRSARPLLLAVPVAIVAALLTAAPLWAQTPPAKAEPKPQPADPAAQKADADAGQRAAQDADRRKPKRDGERKPLPQREREEEDDRR